MRVEARDGPGAVTGRPLKAQHGSGGQAEVRAGARVSSSWTASLCGAFHKNSSDSKHFAVRTCPRLEPTIRSSSTEVCSLSALHPRYGTQGIPLYCSWPACKNQLTATKLVLSCIKPDINAAQVDTTGLTLVDNKAVSRASTQHLQGKPLVQGSVFCLHRPQQLPLASGRPVCRSVPQLAISMGRCAACIGHPGQTSLKPSRVGADLGQGYQLAHNSTYIDFANA